MTPPPLLNEIGKRATDVIYGGRSSVNYGYKPLCTIQLNKKFEKYGMNSYCKWDTNNVIKTGVSSLPTLCERVKFAGKSSVQMGYKWLRVGTEYKNTILVVNNAADFKTAGPVVVNSSWLLARRTEALKIVKNGTLFAGVHLEVDCKTDHYFKQSRCKIAFGHFVPDQALIAVVIGGKKQELLGHCRLSKNLEFGVALQWLHEFELIRKWTYGLKYTFNNGCNKFRLQTNSYGQVFFVFTQKIRDEIDLSFSAVFDKRIHLNRNGQSPWRYGFGIDFNFKGI